MRKKTLLDRIRELFGLTPKKSRSTRYRLEFATSTRQQTLTHTRSHPNPSVSTRQGERSGTDSSNSSSRSRSIEWKTVESRKTSRQMSSSTSKGQIDWGSVTGSGTPDLSKLIGVEDAFDHTPLLAGEEIAFCRRDQVAYHIATWEFLKAQNQGKCCICGQTNVIRFFTLPGTLIHPPTPVVPVQPRVTLRSGEKIINLQDVPNFLNLVVNFQDFVHDVYCTQNTGTYFVRFQKREYGDTPFSGFKLVIFPDYQSAWQSAGISIESYRGRTIRVRGLIQKHEKWGMEIIVNSPYMIEIIK